MSLVTLDAVACTVSMVLGLSDYRFVALKRDTLASSVSHGDQKEEAFSEKEMLHSLAAAKSAILLAC